MLSWPGLLHRKVKISVMALAQHATPAHASEPVSIPACTQTASGVMVQNEGGAGIAGMACDGVSVTIRTSVKTFVRTSPKSGYLWCHCFE
jgi:hypothetical protein